MVVINVLNKHTLKTASPHDHYIGRGNALGNPFVMGPTMSRVDAVAEYEIWLHAQIKNQDMAVIEELDKLANHAIDHGQVNLICFCAPQLCHGDIVKKFLCEAINGAEDVEPKVPLVTPGKHLKYAGIGSRATPESFLPIMEDIGEQLSTRWMLRSGHAVGADQAFERGAINKHGLGEIFLPWAGYNQAPIGESGLLRYIVPSYTQELYDYAARHHPAWDKCTDITKKLHSRNVCQILGENGDDPVDMVVCWTLWGKGGGGTGQAIRIAKNNGIPVYDIALEADQERLVEFTEAMERKG